MRELTIDATIENIPVVTGFVDESLEELGCPLKAQMQMTSLPSIQMTWRVEGGFFNIRIR